MPNVNVTRTKGTPDDLVTASTEIFIGDDAARVMFGIPWEAEEGAEATQMISEIGKIMETAGAKCADISAAVMLLRVALGELTYPINAVNSSEPYVDSSVRENLGKAQRAVEAALGKLGFESEPNADNAAVRDLAAQRVGHGRDFGITFGPEVPSDVRNQIRGALRRFISQQVTVARLGDLVARYTDRGVSIGFANEGQAWEQKGAGGGL